MAISYLERIADSLIEKEGIPTPIREYRFTPERKWRCDYVWINDHAKVIMEIEGGVFHKSRHTSGTGFTADCEKYNEAALLGFTVLRVTKYHLITGQAMEWVKRALKIPRDKEMAEIQVCSVVAPKPLNRSVLKI